MYTLDVTTDVHARHRSASPRSAHSPSQRTASSPLPPTCPPTQGTVYTSSKALLTEAAPTETGKNYPRQCSLLFAVVNDEPRFGYGMPGGHPFDTFVETIRARYDLEEVKPGLLAFLVYLSGAIASTGVPKRGKGHKDGIVSYGEIPDHDEWQAGIERAVKFLSSRERCPSGCAAARSYAPMSAQPRLILGSVASDALQVCARDGHAEEKEGCQAGRQEGQQAARHVGHAVQDASVERVWRAS